MQERLRGYYAKLLERWDLLEAGQKTRLIITVVVLIATLIATVFLLTRPKWAVLVSGEDYKVIGKLETLLQNENVRTKVTDNTTSISVQEKDLDRAMILTSSDEELTSEGFTYQNALDASGMSATDTVRKENFKRLKEADLARAISSIKGVQSANVFITPVDDTGFLIEAKTEPSASIFLETTMEIDDAQAKTIANFVAASVKGLKIDNIEITDQNANSIFSGLEKQQGTTGNKYSIQTQQENKMDAEIRAALFRYFDEIKVLTSLKFDWSEVERTTDIYTPPVEDGSTGLPRRTTNVTENATNMVPDAEPGIGGNDNVTETYEQGNTTQGTASRKESATEYELNREQSREVSSTGDLIANESSLAVIANRFKHYYEESMTEEQLNGQTWQEFKDTMQQQRAPIEYDQSLVPLLITGTGIPTVTLFAYEVPVFHDKITEPMPLGSFAMFALLALIILLLAFGLIRKAQPDEITEVEPELSVEDLMVSTKMEEEKEIEQEKEAERLREIEFNAESEAKRQIEKFIVEKPEAVAQLMRNWLNDEWE